MHAEKVLLRDQEAKRTVKIEANILHWVFPFLCAKINGNNQCEEKLKLVFTSKNHHIGA
jgi:hypothetical protein